MCPGGYVLSSGTDEDGIVCNGMSNYKRNSQWANSALVVTIDHETHFKNQLLGGLNFRRELETTAKKMVIQNGGTKQLPSQKLIDFLDGRKSRDLISSSSPSGVTSARLDLLLPSFLKDSLIDGISEFNKNMRGFISPNAQLYAIESRTSCPLRVVRDPLTYQSLTHTGLYPAGEGAGYAGGITSAACDGINIADAISKQFSKREFEG